MTQAASHHGRRQPAALRFMAISLALVVSLLSACHSESKPVKSFALHVDSEGRYTLDGTKVEPARLKEALGSLAKSGSSVELRIHTKPNSNHQAVGRAVEAAQQARIVIIVFVEEPLK